MRLSRLARAEGSVLLWAVAALAVGALTALTAAGVASLVSAQRQLAHAADTAALAAANQVAVATFRSTGSFADLGVNLSAAVTAAQQALAVGEFDAKVTAVVTTSSGVRVEVRGRWSPPLGLPRQELRAQREVVLVIGD